MRTKEFSKKERNKKKILLQIFKTRDRLCAGIMMCFCVLRNATVNVEDYVQQGVAKVT